MVTEQEIERKDFSMALPSIIGRLNIVYEIIDDDTGGDELLALLDIIRDARRDLKIVTRGLYGTEALAESATAPIS
jgi:hypothetical protein